MAERAPQEVFDDHLLLRQNGDLDSDLQRNYAPNVKMITGYGVFHGHDGVRRSATILRGQLHGAHFIYRTRLVFDRVAFLEWAAEADDILVSDGADTYVIEDGRIVIQTVHYTLSTLGSVQTATQRQSPGQRSGSSGSQEQDAAQSKQAKDGR